tara:strand:+ start:201 stop:485 length:285 start_codon:yes stop_codon:yes gene_type:complete
MIVNEQLIYNEMYDTYLSILPFEILEHILNISAFKIHCKKQYFLNKEIIRKNNDKYLNNYILLCDELENNEYEEYDEDCLIEVDELIMEVVNII